MTLMIRTTCNCIMSFNPHYNTGNKALLVFLFLLYRWKPWGLEILNDTGSGIADLLVMFLWCDVMWCYDHSISLNVPEYFFLEPPTSPPPPVSTKLHYTLGPASTCSTILTLPLLLLDFFNIICKPPWSSPLTSNHEIFKSECGASSSMSCTIFQPDFST